MQNWEKQLVDQKASIQTDVDRLETWVGRWSSRNANAGPAHGKEKTSCCSTGWPAGKQHCGAVSPGGKQVNHDPTAYPGGKKTSDIVGFIRKTVANKLREEILTLYSAQIRPCLEYCTLFWAPQYRKHNELLDRVWWKAIKMGKELENFFDKKRLRELGLFSL